jgi:hypothetical protein
MAKFQSPLLGYNNNVRHKGRVFHIQTEDSGVNHPHVITHLFMDGGRILKSVKRSYAEHVGTDKMSETVRVLMKEQHKAMFIALRDGQFDELVEPSKAKLPGASSSSASLGAVKPPEASPSTVTSRNDPSEAAPSEAIPDTGPIAPPAEAIAAAEAAPETTAEAAPEPPAVTIPEPPPTTSERAPTTIAERREEATQIAAEALAGVMLANLDANPDTRVDRQVLPDAESSSGPDLFVEFAADSDVSLDLDSEVSIEIADEVEIDVPFGPATEEESPKTSREPEPRHPSAAELTLDFDALERDSHAVSPVFHNTDLPPPPRNIFATGRQIEPGTGSYRTLEADGHHDSTGVPASRPGSRPDYAVPPAPRTPSTPIGRTVARSPSQAPPPSRPGAALPSGRPKERPSAEGRYAPARPAAIFGASPSRPPPSPPSIFSDDLVGDKSLDEVILSYLAEDLDPPRRK